MRTFLRVLVVALTTLFAGAITGTTTASAATFTYDSPTLALVGAHQLVAAEVGQSQLGAAREESASPSAEPGGTSTTPRLRNDATNTADDAMAGVRAAGAQGEAAAGIVKNTQRIPSLSGSAPYRIPDGLGNGVLSEVKNVSSLSYTSQLRDFAGYAQQEGLAFNLYVRGSTTLSGPLQAAVDNGTITLIRSLPG